MLRLTLGQSRLCAGGTPVVARVIDSMFSGRPLPSSAMHSIPDYLARSLSQTPRNELSRFILACGYMNLLEPKNYDAILSRLHRTDAFVARKDPDSSSTLSNLKKFELMLRCGLVPQCSYNDLSKFAKKYLLTVRGTPLDALATSVPESSEIVEALEGIAHSVKSSMVGPFEVVFCQMKEPVAFAPINPDPDIRVLAKHFTAVEILAEGQDSDVDWKIRSAALASLGIRNVVVPVADWKLLDGNRTAQQIYLTSLLQR